MKKKTRIQDIAEKLGITTSTVSRALADHPRISKNTKNKVLKLAEEMNYQPNKMAANLRSGRGFSIGVIVPRINRSFFSNAIAGMESVTNAAGYTLMICQTNEKQDAEVLAMQSLINNRVDGIIMSLSAETNDVSHIQNLIKSGVPMVQFDRVCEDLSMHKVINDNLEGAYHLTKFLIKRGYQKIFHFSGPLHITIYRDRYAGYVKAMKESGLELPSGHLYERVLTLDKGEKTMQEILKSKSCPEAVFCASDFSALGARRALDQLDEGQRPVIEIAGFGNEPFTELMKPQITSVEQYSLEMGREAARLLIHAIDHEEEIEAPKEIIIKTKLIGRN